MNQILNKIYNDYSQDISYYTIARKNTLYSSIAEKNYEHLTSTFHILYTIRANLSNKQYSEAKALLVNLEIDDRIIEEINLLIKELESTNDSYSIIDDDNTNFISILSSLDSITKQINTIPELLKQNSPIQTNEINNEIINKLESFIQNINNSSNNNNSNLGNISQESLNYIADYCKKLSSEQDNLTSISKLLNEITPKLQDIRNTISDNLKQTKDEYFIAVKSLKEQTIKEIEEIKNSSIEASKLIASDIPNEIKKFKDEIKLEIESSIKGNQKSNFILFSVVLFLITWGGCWWQGYNTGTRTASLIINYIKSTTQVADKLPFKRH